MSRLDLGRDITALAREGALDPVVGREREIDDMLRALCRRTKSNPLLLGPPGVGKTALVEGIASLSIDGRVPRSLRTRPIWELQLGSLLAGTQFRGDFEKRLEDFLASARQERSIVFIDEIHLLVLAGRGSGMDAANLLKPALARSEISFIGATTPEEAQEMFRIDPALERRFQPILINEPDEPTTRAILEALRPRFEAHHGLKICDASLDASLVEAKTLPGDRKNPDRALDLLEDACASLQLAEARTQQAGHVPDSSLSELKREVQSALIELDLDRHVRAREAYEARALSNLGVEESEAVRCLEARHVREIAAQLRHAAADARKPPIPATRVVGIA